MDISKNDNNSTILIDMESDGCIVQLSDPSKMGEGFKVTIKKVDSSNQPVIVQMPTMQTICLLYLRSALNFAVAHLLRTSEHLLRTSKCIYYTKPLSSVVNTLPKSFPISLILP